MRAKITRIDADTKALRIRIDCTPDPVDSTYDECRVMVPVRDLTPEEEADPALAALVPTIEQVNPIQCHFLNVPLAATRDDVRAEMIAHLRELKRAIAAKERASDFIGAEVTDNA